MDRTISDEIRTTMDDVHLVIPACSEFLRALRLVAADAAVRAGLDCEEVEDFRIAVDELSHAVMAATDHHVRVFPIPIRQRARPPLGLGITP